MKINWLQPWFDSRWRLGPPGPKSAGHRWPFNLGYRRRKGCAPPNPTAKEVDQPPAGPHRITVSLLHHLDVAVVTQYLLGKLGCDAWYVVCHQRHQMVVRLTREGAARYCVSYDCSPPVEKGVYHGCRAWALAIIPLHGEDNLPEQKVAELKAGLSALYA